MKRSKNSKSNSRSRSRKSRLPIRTKLNRLVRMRKRTMTSNMFLSASWTIDGTATRFNFVSSGKTVSAPGHLKRFSTKTTFQPSLPTGALGKTDDL